MNKKEAPQEPRTAANPAADRLREQITAAIKAMTRFWDSEDGDAEALADAMSSLRRTGQANLRAALARAAADPVAATTRWHIEAAIERLTDSIESMRATGAEPNVLTDAVDLLQRGLRGEAPGMTAKGYSPPVYGTPTSDPLAVTNAEAVLREAALLLSHIRDADVIFGKGDWLISQRIDPMIDRIDAALSAQGNASGEGDHEHDWQTFTGSHIQGSATVCSICGKVQP